MKTKLMTMMTLSVAAALAASTADARPGGYGKHHGGHHGPRMFDPQMLEMAAGKLGLDDATLARIKDRAHRGQKEGISLEGELKSARLDLRRTLDSERPDRAEVMRLAERVGQAHIKMKKHHLSVMLDIREMLTPDQVAQLKTMRKELRKERRQRWKERKRDHGERRE